jgi:hypothetical protein
MLSGTNSVGLSALFCALASNVPRLKPPDRPDDD